MADEKHEIKTLQDILRVVTVENSEAFLKDFEAYIATWSLIRTTIEAVAPETLEKTVASARFTWVNDGKHDIRLNFQVQQAPKDV